MIAPQDVRSEDAWLLAEGAEKVMQDMNDAKDRWRMHRANERKRIEGGIETDYSRWLRGAETRD